MGIRHEAAYIAGALDQNYLDTAAQHLQRDASMMNSYDFQNMVNLANQDRQNPQADYLRPGTDANSGLPVVEIVAANSQVDMVVPIASAPPPEQYPGYPPPPVPGSPSYDYPTPGSPMYDAPSAPPPYDSGEEAGSTPCSGSTVVGGLLGSVLGSAIAGRRPLVGAIAGGIAGAAVGSEACEQSGPAGGGY
jgi:hypothetical protein